MFLAAATLSWMLTTNTPDGVSTVTFDSEEACEEARDEYNDELDNNRQRRRDHAECSLPPEDTEE